MNGTKPVAPATSQAVDRRTLIQLAGLVLCGIGAAMALRSAAPIGSDLSGNAVAQEVLAQAEAEARERPEKGADLILLVFTDYRCPACRTAHDPMLAAVQNDGKVQVIYRHLPVFGPASRHAARVSIAAGYQGIQPALHNLLMRAPGIDDVQLRAAVEQTGGSWQKLEHDLAERRGAIDMALEQAQTQAFALGLGGTPGYLAGPVLVRGGLSEAEFTRLFRQAREVSEQ